MSVFDSSRLKIKWAKQHIADLNDHVAAFLASDPHALDVKTHPETGEDSLHFRLVKPVPEELPLCIGDAIHNLRSALDLAVNSIIFDYTGTYNKHAVFPFRETRDDLADRLNGGAIKQASPEVVNLIVDVIKPYRGGDDFLFALHDLDILDKHRLLIPMMKVAALVGIDAEDDRGNVMKGSTFVITRPDGALTAISGAKNLKVKNKGKPTFNIIFEAGFPLAGESIYVTLRRFWEKVDGIVDAIDAAYIRRAQRNP